MMKLFSLLYIKVNLYIIYLTGREKAAIILWTIQLLLIFKATISSYRFFT